MAHDLIYHSGICYQCRRPYNLGVIGRCNDCIVTHPHTRYLVAWARQNSIDLDGLIRRIEKTFLAQWN